jgi:hypothetical protein
VQYSKATTSGGGHLLRLAGLVPAAERLPKKVVFPTTLCKRLHKPDDYPEMAGLSCFNRRRMGNIRNKSQVEAECASARSIPAFLSSP